MNTVTETQRSVNWTVAQPSRTARQRYWDGFDAYMRGASEDEVSRDPQMLRGWHAACNAEAEAGLPGYAAKMGW